MDERHPIDGDCGGNAAPYVLGALTPEEHQAFADHLSSCAVCREEVSALQMVTASLPATAPQVAAPRKLKRRVMSEVRADARAAESMESAGRARSTGTRRRWLPALAPVALGLAAVALLAVLVIGTGSGSSSRVVQAQVTAPGASASVLTSGGHAQIVVANMPQVRAGRVYEVWIKRSGAPAPTDALFTVSSHGDATVAVPGNISGVKELLVTSEPLGGSHVPTTTPVVVAKLS